MFNLNRKCRQHSTPVAAFERALPISTSPSHSDTFPGQLPTDVFVLILSWAYHHALMFLPFKCYINVRFLEYFLHSFLPVWLCDDPALLIVREIAKIQTQGTRRIPPSLYLWRRICPTRIIGEPALLLTPDTSLDAKRVESHWERISMLAPFWW